MQIMLCYYMARMPVVAALADESLTALFRLQKRWIREAHTIRRIGDWKTDDCGVAEVHIPTCCRNVKRENRGFPKWIWLLYGSSH